MKAGLLRRAAHALTSLAALLAGVALAAHHPAAPSAAVAAFVIGFAVMAARPGVWLLLVPASLPWLNFAPWTGWLTFDEFDVLLLCAASAGHARLALRASAHGTAPMAQRTRAVAIPAALFVAISTAALLLGLADAGGFSFAWFQGYADPMNSLRVFKPLAFALLLLAPMWADVRAGPARAVQRVGAGMVAGLVVVTLAVLWERWATPGLLNFSSRYRTVALFWEMHVGGAALDAYLALATPFAAWALARARTPTQWGAAAVLALLTAFACLTTFSRGAYVAVFAPLAVLGGSAWWLQRSRRAPQAWRRSAWRALAVALVIEVLVVAGSGSFLMERIGRSDQDLRSRLDHWARGVGLLHDPSDWIAGIGLGRLPAQFARFVAGHEFSGGAKLGPIDAGRRSVAIAGPASQTELEGLFALTQRVALADGGAYKAEFDVRVAAPASVWVTVCEMHLLYDRQCQGADLQLKPATGRWQHIAVPLTGPSLSPGDWFAPRLGVFSISVATAGAVAEFADIRLYRNGLQALVNGSFTHDMARWWPAAQSHFLPWHIDNLYLEILVERGPAALLCFLVLMGMTLWRLVSEPSEIAIAIATLRPVIAASLCGALAVGLVSSVMDVPRVAFLLFFLVAFATALDAAAQDELRRASSPA